MEIAMTHDAVSVTAMLVLSAFALERVTKGLFFLLSFLSRWKARFPEPSTIAEAGARHEAAKKQRLAYFVVCGLLAFVVVCLSPEFRVLSAMDIEGPRLLDFSLTWLVLMAGSDRIQDFMQDRKAAVTGASTEPIQIEGTVTVVNGSEPNVQRVRISG
jgi:hypothetical protein